MCRELCHAWFTMPSLDNVLLADRFVVNTCQLRPRLQDWAVCCQAIRDLRQREKHVHTLFTVQTCRALKRQCLTLRLLVPEPNLAAALLAMLDTAVKATDAGCMITPVDWCEQYQPEAAELILKGNVLVAVTVLALGSTPLARSLTVCKNSFSPCTTTD